MSKQGNNKPLTLSPAEKLENALKNELLKLNCSIEEIGDILKEIPRKWEKHGDLVLLPHYAFTSKIWTCLGDNLHLAICSTLKVTKIARKNTITPDGFRTPRVELLFGDSSWVTHKDNGIKYSWDVTKCMFSIGNITEKLRIAKFDCSEETVVDLFAGIGYFTLVYLIHAKAKYVHACEWNPDAVAALKVNLKQNGVENRCTVYQGDNRETCLNDVADRINLGFIPSSACSWETACRALRSSTGGVLHVHANIETKPGSPIAKDSAFKYEEWRTWTNETINRFETMLCEIKGNKWKVGMIHLEHVKSYAPHVDHVVLDLECRPRLCET